MSKQNTTTAAVEVATPRRDCLQMADKSRHLPEGGVKNDDENKPEESRSLELFVTDHYQKQKDDGKMEATEEICDERTTNFFERAISESRRMNAEVNKSNKKLDSLHQEFGLEMVNSWQTEHASEVLQPHEAALIKQAQYQ